MKVEFEKLAGYEVSDDDYNSIIEPMYMSTDLSKEEFVKVIDKNRFALKTIQEIVEEMKTLARHLRDTCEHYTDYEALDKLNVLAEEYKERTFAYGFTTNCKYTLDYIGECRGCSYPVKMEFYDKAYHTMDIIRLV